MSTWRVTTAADLAGALAGARAEAGMTQAELAEWAQVNRRYLSVLETGGGSLQVQRVLNLLSVLGYELVVAPKGARPALER